ncbi:unnamed protein product, partial [Calicophoron daubneyi]
RSSDQNPLPHVTPVVMQESFSLTQLILVATCCVLVGSLVTAVLFFTFWRSCHRGLRAPRHKHPHHCRCSQTEFYTEGGRHDPSPKGASHMEKNWVVTKGNKSDWSHKLCDPETIWNKDANGSDRYQIPPNLERLRSRGFYSEPVNTQYDSCLSQLISATPLPSPVSVVSSPSTASTVLKEKVAFFPPETEEEHPDIGLSSVEKETAVTPPNWTATKPRKPTPPRITIEPKISSLHPPQRTESSKTESDGSSKATLTPGQKTNGKQADNNKYDDEDEDNDDDDNYNPDDCSDDENGGHSEQDDRGDVDDDGDDADDDNSDDGYDRSGHDEDNEGDIVLDDQVQQEGDEDNVVGDDEGYNGDDDVDDVSGDNAQFDHDDDEGVLNDDDTYNDNDDVDDGDGEDVEDDEDEYTDGYEDDNYDGGDGKSVDDDDDDRDRCS